MVDETKTFATRQENLPDILSWAYERVRRTTLEDGEQKRVELALEEAIVNILVHGAKEIPCELTIVFRHEENRQFEFDLIDTAPAFNPLTQPISDQSELPSEKREPGGLGLLLMKKCMDAISYHFDEGRNVLTLTKNL